MKNRLLIILIFIGTFFKVNSQTLEFSQVISEDSMITFSNCGIYYSNTFTVPNNKVWKIEYLNIGSNIQWMINDTYIDHGKTGSIGTSSSGSVGYSLNAFTAGSIWLKGGDQLKGRWHLTSGNGNCGNGVLPFYFSAIEFNTQ